MKIIKKVLNIVFYIICALLIAYFLFNIALKIFGYTARIVETESMVPTLKVGTIVYDKKVSFNDLKVGDIITYQSSSYNRIITHRINSIDYDALTFIAKGDNNISADPSDSASSILGKVVFSLPPFIGYIIAFIQNNYIFILIIALIVIVAATIIDKVLKDNKEKVNNN